MADSPAELADVETAAAVRAYYGLPDTVAVNLTDNIPEGIALLCDAKVFEP